MSAREPNKKRKRDGGKEKATVGQLTSHIRNKQVRSDQYGKLRHKAKVRPFTQLLAPRRVILDTQKRVIAFWRRLSLRLAPLVPCS